MAFSFSMLKFWHWERDFLMTKGCSLRMFLICCSFKLSSFRAFTWMRMRKWRTSMKKVRMRSSPLSANLLRVFKALLLCFWLS